MDDQRPDDGAHEVAGHETAQPELQLDVEPRVEPDVLAAEIRAQGAEIRAELAELRATIAREHDRAAAREHVIDRLHEENQRLRAGERSLLLRPVLTDLQRLRHEMLREGSRLPESFDARQAALLLCSYADELELTLERCGVRVVSPEPGSPFDASAHRATGTVAVDDPAHDTTIAEVVLDGYHDAIADRTVVAAAVRVNRWTPDRPDALPEYTAPEYTAPESVALEQERHS